jgi:hypothetical protein
MPSSGFFLRKKPHGTMLDTPHEFENRRSEVNDVAVNETLQKEDVEMKWEHLIKPLSSGSITWPATSAEKQRQMQSDMRMPRPAGNAEQIWLKGNEHLEGMDVNWHWRVLNSVGDFGWNKHSHPYPQCLFFVGLDTANVTYLGAEVECRLGAEGESYSFDEPTVVMIPPGVPHGPVVTKRLFSPRGFGCFAVDLNAVLDVTWSGENGVSTPAVQSAGRYAHLVKSLKAGVVVQGGKLNPARLDGGEFKRGPGSPDQLTWMSGKDLGEINLSIAWGFCSQPGIWQRGADAHVHPSDVALIVLGTDPKSESFGGEVEIDLGEEHERYLIDKSCVIACRAGVPHGPIVTRWVEKPFAFVLIGLAADLSMSAA